MILEISLTGGDTFPPELINRTKNRMNQKINFPSNTKRCICTTAINNGWNTHIVQILHEERDRKFHFSVNIITRIPKTVELSQK